MILLVNPIIWSKHMWWLSEPVSMLVCVMWSHIKHSQQIYTESAKSHYPRFILRYILLLFSSFKAVHNMYFYGCMCICASHTAFYKSQNPFTLCLQQGIYPEKEFRHLHSWIIWNLLLKKKSLYMYIALTPPVLKHKISGHWKLLVVVNAAKFLVI